MPQKILIVDDEPNIVVPLQFLMERNGYETCSPKRGGGSGSHIQGKT